MTDIPIPDADARAQALDPTRSFIVQAPAGSGKTTLLAQRFLQLLNRVDRPEEVLAITFTRKAASEMRHRVLSLLAEDTPIASAVRARDAQRGWQISSNPNILKIQTIDSFALEIASQTPQLETSAGVGITEQARDYYQQAASALLLRLHQRDATAPAVAQFLALRDNDAGSAVSLLSDMLARRDQWLHQVQAIAANPDDAVTERLLGQAMGAVRDSLESQLLQRFGADDLAMLEHVADLTQTGDSLDERLALLRTKTDTLRKQMNKRDGITDPEQRREINQWLASLHQRGFESLIVSHGHLPGPHPSAQQKAQLRLVCLALALAAVELERLLQRERMLDFTGLLLRAKAALRDDNGPTDLALFLDYQIRHILVDEYQDTSRAQLEFFNMLTEGWLADSGNTFFAVGDPMQSIYRFRDADVSIFADGLERGLDNVPLTPLRLHANFRSDAGVVDWCNRMFENLFGNAGQRAAQLGEVPYNNATPMLPAAADTEINNWRFATQTDETVAITRRLKRLQKQDTETSIAILCRTRPQVGPLLALLKAQQVPVQATDMDLLAEKPVIRDLSNLHKVVLGSAEPLAWFALLRSPLFGLSLAQLLDLRERGIDNAAALAAVPATDLLPRPLNRLREALDWVQARLYEVPLREVIEGAWFRCGAADAYDPMDLGFAARWFDLLEDLQIKAYDAEQLALALQELYATTSNEAQIQVMTIHKAKGLEFDHVIVPYLDRGTGSDDAPLLRWRAGAPGLLMGVKGDSVHAWLSYEEKQRAHNEDKRVLYVACTRARKTLTLTHTCAEDSKPKALAGWLPDPDIQPAELGAAAPAAAGQTDLFAAQPLLARLPADYRWQPPAYAPVPGPAAATVEQDHISDRDEVALGNLVHRALAWYADHQPADLSGLSEHVARWCGELAVAVDKRELLTRITREHLERTLSETAGRWILQANSDAYAELPLTGVLDGALHNVVVDRTFVDNRRRWIIDYKTAMPNEDETVDVFVQREVNRYAQQLNTYALIAAETFGEPVTTALYFTALGRLYEVSRSAATDNAEENLF